MAPSVFAGQTEHGGAAPRPEGPAWPSRRTFVRTARMSAGRPLGRSGSRPARATRVVAAATCALALSALGACGSPDDAGGAVRGPAPSHPPTTPAVARRPKPTFRLAILTDPKGYLAPCGCTSRPLGGVDRMAALVRGLEADGVPVALLAAGSLFFDGVDRGAAGAEPDRWRAETLIDVWNELGIDAATPGVLDLTYGADVLRELADTLARPLVASNVGLDRVPAGLPPIQRLAQVTLGGTKLGVVGVADLARAPRATPGLRFDADPIEAARSAVADARAAGAKVVVALVSGDRALANRVAGIDGVDFVVRGGLDQAEAIPPSARGAARLVHAGHQGQGVLVIDVYARGAGELVDASPWTRRAEREAREAEATALEARIAEWARDPAVQPGDLEEQRARLAAMRAEIARSADAPFPETGNAFVAEWRELDPDAPRDTSIASALERFDVRVNDRNREAFAGVLPPAAAPGQPSYVGSATCGRCHAAAFAWWERHPHGRAYATLVDRHKEFHLDCVGCHVTGYDQPGGSNVTHHLDGALVNVGCESCHGPGSQHVADPTATPRTVVRATPESTCVGCHNEEHSDRFEFEAYRRRLIAPGHGAGAGS